ncbi:post-segregation antitoxin (ccd killing protein) [Xanthomonas arboricola]|nr:post-segregation antitoxin (ccd killing protein) [Xanthomonas arboricola]
MNDTLAGILGTFPHFGSKWMPLPVERATNTCTAWHRRSDSGTTATTRTAYVAQLRDASMCNYTRVRHTTRWRVSEEPAAGRARFDQAIGLLHADLFAYMRGACVTPILLMTSPKKRCSACWPTATRPTSATTHC